MNVKSVHVLQPNCARSYPRAENEKKTKNLLGKEPKYIFLVFKSFY